MSTAPWRTQLIIPPARVHRGEVRADRGGAGAGTADAGAAISAGGRQAANADAQRDAAAVRGNAAEGESVDGIDDIRGHTSCSMCACRFDGAAEYTALNGVIRIELAGALRSMVERP